VYPTVVNGGKAVVVNHGLKRIEPLAYRFVVNFAKDNGLPMTEVSDIDHLQAIVQ
jgi:hypothetical protein